MNSRKLVTRLIVFLFLVSAGAPVLVGFSVPKAEEFTKVVNYPLPSVPEPVLSGGDLRVEVKAGSDTSGWSARLFSRFGTSGLEFLNGSFTDDLWTLYFKAPTGLPPELYDLEIEYVEGGETIQYTQSRCVWLMDEWPDSITISHISDLHEQHGRDPIAQYINEVNLIDPDLIIATGDIVQTETVAAGWDYLHAQMELIDVPSYLLPGNHDHAGGSSRIYQRYAGPLNYSVALGDFLIVTLDSHIEGQDWVNQFQWVESELQKNADKIKILAWHHPLIGFEIEDITGEPAGYNITGSWETIEQWEDIVYYGWQRGPEIKETAYRDLIRLIQVYDVRLILSGHTHFDIIHILNNRHYFINAGPVGGGLPPGQYHGSRLVTISTQLAK
jgi:predicted MPP superfamily phosphohydrolase